MSKKIRFSKNIAKLYALNNVFNITSMNEKYNLINTTSKEDSNLFNITSKEDNNIIININDSKSTNETLKKYNNRIAKEFSIAKKSEELQTCKDNNLNNVINYQDKKFQLQIYFLLEKIIYDLLNNSNFEKEFDKEDLTSKINGKFFKILTLKGKKIYINYEIITFNIISDIYNKVFSNFSKIYNKKITLHLMPPVTKWYCLNLLKDKTEKYYERETNICEDVYPYDLGLTTQFDSYIRNIILDTSHNYARHFFYNNNMFVSFFKNLYNYNKYNYAIIRKIYDDIVNNYTLNKIKKNYRFDDIKNIYNNTLLTCHECSHLLDYLSNNSIDVFNYLSSELPELLNKNMRKYDIIYDFYKFFDFDKINNIDKVDNIYFKEIFNNFYKTKEEIDELKNFFSEDNLRKIYNDKNCHYIITTYALNDLFYQKTSRKRDMGEFLAETGTRLIIDDCRNDFLYKLLNFKKTYYNNIIDYVHEILNDDNKINIIKNHKLCSFKAICNFKKNEKFNILNNLFIKKVESTNIAKINIKIDNNEYNLNKDIIFDNDCKKEIKIDIYGFLNYGEYKNIFENTDYDSSINIDLDSSYFLKYYMRFKKCNFTDIKINMPENKCLTNLNSMFEESKNLKSVDLSNFDTTNIKSMNLMFYECTNIENINLANFNTKEVQDMRCMFAECFNIENLNLESFKINQNLDVYHIFNHIKRKNLVITDEFYLYIYNNVNKEKKTLIK